MVTKKEEQPVTAPPAAAEALPREPVSPSPEQSLKPVATKKEEEPVAPPAEASPREAFPSTEQSPKTEQAVTSPVKDTRKEESPQETVSPSPEVQSLKVEKDDNGEFVASIQEAATVSDGSPPRAPSPSPPPPAVVEEEVVVVKKPPVKKGKKDKPVAPVPPPAFDPRIVDRFDLVAMLDDPRENLLLLDIRPTAETEEGVIPGASCVPFAELADVIAAEPDVFIGVIVLGATACEMIGNACGNPNVFWYPGGYHDWVANTADPEAIYSDDFLSDKEEGGGAPKSDLVTAPKGNGSHTHTLPGWAFGCPGCDDCSK